VSGDAFKTEIDPVTAAELMAGFGKCRDKLCVLLRRRYFAGQIFFGLCGRIGERKLRAAIESEVRELHEAAGDFAHFEVSNTNEWRAVESVISDHFNPELEEVLSGCPSVCADAGKLLFPELQARADQEQLAGPNICDLINILNDDVKKINAELIAVGRHLVDLREQMGERTLREAFRKRFPNSRFQVAQDFMDWALVEESKNE
jgi:hypothetical protein